MTPKADNAPAPINYEYAVIQAFEQYPKGSVISDPKEIERIKQMGLFGFLVRTPAGVHTPTGELQGPTSVRPVRHKNLAPFNAQKQKMLADNNREVSDLGIDLGAIRHPTIRKRVTDALQGYQYTRNPIFLFEIMQWLPDDVPLPQTIRHYFKLAFARTVESAYAIANEAPNAPSPDEAVSDLVWQLDLASVKGIDNAFTNFKAYKRDWDIAEQVQVHLAAGKPRKKAVGLVAGATRLADKTVARCLMRFRWVIKSRI